MKIYFEDGPLRSEQKLEITPDYYCDAKNGYSQCESFLWNKHKAEPNAIVYTNYLEALSSVYGWNDATKEHDIFLREDGCGCFKKEIIWNSGI